jgi:hypothetical protein
MGKLVNLQGQVLNPDPPSGFYKSGSCPVCNYPIFYHGAGEYTLTHPAGPATHHQLPEAVFPTCDCPKGEMDLSVPHAYDLYLERQAIATLFQVIQAISALNVQLTTMLQECVDEGVAQNNASF